MIIEQKISDTLVRHYSDAGMMILQTETGILYSDAIDLIPCRYTYQETDIEEEQTAAEIEAEYMGYLKELGVEINE